MARPIKEISQREFEALCAIQCTQAEICSVLDVTDKTLMRWCRKTYKKGFSEMFEQKRAGGKASLRRAMYKKAMDGNPTMMIWLSKQYLGMSEKVEVDQREVLERLDAALGGVRDAAERQAE